MKPIYHLKNKDDEVVTPVDASTVILLRDRSDRSFEVFFLQRHIKQDFMGGMFVFPGGRLEQSDCDSDLFGFTGDFSPVETKKALNEPDLDDHVTLGLFFAAIRETFEEAGVLLATTRSGESLDFSDLNLKAGFKTYQQEIHQKKSLLKDMAEKENLAFTLEALTPYAHWITPEDVKKRFDTRFFLARMPKDQSPVHDEIETTDSLWVTPEGALQRHRAGDIMLAPPTLKIVEDLLSFQTADEVFESVEPERILPILPQPMSYEGNRMMVLPYDMEYSISEYKQPPRPDETSRVVMKNGLWQTLKADG